MLAGIEARASAPDFWSNQAEAQKTLQRRRRVEEDVALITAADKLHNLTAIVRDVRAHGPETLRRFSRPERIVWYYGAMTEALSPHAERAPGALGVAPGAEHAVHDAGGRVGRRLSRGDVGRGKDHRQG